MVTVSIWFAAKRLDIEVKFSLRYFISNVLKPSFITNIYNDFSTNTFTSNGRLLNCLSCFQRRKIKALFLRSSAKLQTDYYILILLILLHCHITHKLFSDGHLLSIPRASQQNLYYRKPINLMIQMSFLTWLSWQRMYTSLF